MRAYKFELSPKEKEILDAIVNKKCFRFDDIAKTLYISKSTVSSHINNIYTKLALPNNSIAGLIWYYYNNNID